MRTSVGLGASLVLLAVAGLGAQQATSGTLSLQDYVEIDQLYARYAHGIDTHAEDGVMYASTYTEDGVLDTGARKFEGRSALIALAQPPGDPTLAHMVVNLAIMPSPEGARAIANMAQLTLGAAGKPPVIRGFGRYEDIIVRTSAGWRFKYKKWVQLTAPDKGTATQ